MWDFIKNLLSFQKEEVSFKRGAGVIDIPEVEDYRDISLGSVQKPVGAPTEFSSEKLINDLPIFDQLQLPVCVAASHVKILQLYLYKKFKIIIPLSVRLVYKICKIFDGFPGMDGTFVHICARILTKYGTVEDSVLKEDTTLSLKKYLDIDPTSVFEIYKFNPIKLPGFAFVDNTPEAIAEAIFQNDAIGAVLDIGDWDSLPVTPPRKEATISHNVVLYKYQKIGGDLKIWFLNSWGKGWLAWVKNWLFPGKGYFWWSQYKNNLRGMVAFLDIPEDVLNKTKALPFKFTKELSFGTNGNDVLELQKLLNSDPATAISLEGVGSKEEETFYFGQKTKDALIKWQLKNGLPSTGYFGQLSIAKANERLPKIDLVSALIMVESGGNDNAIGDKNLTHKAYGCLQIRQPYIDDVNRLWKTNYRAEECLGNRDLSIKVFHAYMSIYEPNGSDEEKSRCHNAGPSWRKNLESTDLYWSKVAKLLKK